MDRIGDITLFLRVLDLGSISAAARSLDLSVAVASQRLKRLESELGVRLLHRTTRRLHPTPEGMALAEQGRPLVEDLEALAGGLRQAGTEVAGTLRVTASASFGREYISPLLPEFLARHPKLTLRLDLNDQLRDLVSDGFDLAVRIGELGDSSLVARRLAENRRGPHPPTCAAAAPRARRRNWPRTTACCWWAATAARTCGGSATAAAAKSWCACAAAWKATTARPCTTPRWPAWASPCTRPGRSARTCAGAGWCSCWPITRSRPPASTR